MIKHQIEALAEAGVTDIVLAVNYRPEVMEAHLKEVFRASSPSPPLRSSHLQGHSPPSVLCNLLDLLLARVQPPPRTHTDLCGLHIV